MGTKLSIERIDRNFPASRQVEVGGWWMWLFQYIGKLAAKSCYLVCVHTLRLSCSFTDKKNSHLTVSVARHHKNPDSDGSTSLSVKQF